MNRPRTRLPRRPTAAGLVLALTVLAASLAAAQEAKPRRVRVTLLQVNDVYQFLPVERGREGGLARVSTLRKRVKSESPHTLLLMAGDTISPSVESITYKGQQMIDAWNQIGLDYAVFGNHEFDFGPEVLRERVRESRFPWLGANVIDRRTGKTFADTQPFVLVDFDGVRVGLFGIVLPETRTTSSPGPNIEFRDSCETAKEVIARLRAAGARAVVALTHLSLAEDKQLARCAEGIDLIVGGHEHTLLQSSSNGVPIFKMTADAREMNRIDLNLDPGTGTVESIDWEVIKVDESVAEDPEFASVPRKYASKIRELSGRVGHSSVALDARSAQSRNCETNVGNLVADSFRRATGADIALMNGGSIRADTVITPGVLSVRDVLSILPFNNELEVLEVTGAQLLEALENGVGRTEPGAEPGRFPQVSGMRYTFDASLPAGRRVKSATVANRPVDPGRTYTVVTTRYVGTGGDGYDVLTNLPRRPMPKLIDSDALRRMIASARSVAPRVEGRIGRLDAGASEWSCTPPAPPASATPRRPARR
ncbi:MAG TPA: 5'-nucleotidase C-terminal domain-containing protein [Pyrinomonadaceae bacterium]|nr:5'-nucleotidase C-terminal domain-containing protein [Pyrinomonadaceae bacterium]